MAEVKDAQSTKVITGLVRFSYPKVFKPESIEEGGEKKYSVNIIIPKSDKETLSKIKKAIEAAKEEGKTSKFAGKIPANLKTPLRDGDEDRPDDEAYHNAYFISCSSKQKPGIIDRHKNEILDEADFYSGCYGRVSVKFFAFNTAGNKGIACGLNNIQKLKDGDPLGGRNRAVDDFADDFDTDEDDDLLG